MASYPETEWVGAQSQAVGALYKTKWRPLLVEEAHKGAFL